MFYFLNMKLKSVYPCLSKKRQNLEIQMANGNEVDLCLCLSVQQDSRCHDVIDSYDSQDKVDNGIGFHHTNLKVSNLELSW